MRMSKRPNSWSALSPPRLLPPSKSPNTPHVESTSTSVGPLGLRQLAIQRLDNSITEEVMTYNMANMLETRASLCSISKVPPEQLSSTTSAKHKHGLLQQLNQLHSFLSKHSISHEARSAPKRPRYISIWARPTASRVAKLTMSGRSASCSASPPSSCTTSFKRHCDSEASELHKSHQTVSQTLRRSTLMRFHVLMMHAETAIRQMSPASRRAPLPRSTLRTRN